ncbi:hypothetical protein COI75_21150 [Bacillus cereus]|nr:hypothetical protein COI75_21150 [Bacillus cereus]
MRLARSFKTALLVLKFHTFTCLYSFSGEETGVSSLFLLNYSPLNILMDCLKWEIPKYRNLTVSNSLGYPRSSYG